MKSNEEIMSDKRLLVSKPNPLTYMGQIKLSSNKSGTVVASRNEDGWEHVSIRLFKGKLPTWEDMCEVKNIFWGDEEQVVQIHPRKSQYVNIVEAFHLWRPADGDWKIMNETED